MQSLGIVVLSLAAGCTVAGPCYAQSQTSVPAASDRAPGPAVAGIEDIVVYGQRRSVGESAQKVPIAITALDPALLRSANTVTIADLGALAPNVQTPTAGTTPGLPNFSIRGIGVNSSVRSIDPAVNIIQDGMVIAYPAGSLQSTFDLESVEILRGPQGVLFGRNATGGAISLRTRRPTRSFQLLTDVSYGNFNTLDANASVEGALGTDAILGKLAVIYHRSDGFIKNTLEGTYVPAPGNPTATPYQHKTGQVGAQDELTIKPTFVFHLSDSNTLTLFGQYERFNDDGSSPRNFVPSTGAKVPLQTVYGYYPTYGNYVTNISDPGYLRLREGHVIGELVNEIGTAKLTTVAAWRHLQYDSTINFYGGPNPLFFLPDNRERNSQYSVESRLNVPLFNDRVELTAGLFYLNYDTKVLENRIRLNATAASPTSRTFVREIFDLKTDALAAFVNANWHITDRLTLSAGGRYSSDKKNFYGTPLVNCIGESFNNCPLVYVDYNKRWNNFSPRAVIDYQAASGILLYGSYTEGFRSGNFNSRATVTAGLAPANPETVKSYEVGIKSDLLGRSLRLNVAGFRENYSDIQQVLTANTAGLAPVVSLLNAAAARIQGVEVEMIAEPVPTLRFQADFGYTDAKFTSFTVPVPGVLDPTTLELARVPKYTVTVALNHTLHLSSLSGKFESRIAYDYRSRIFSDLTNNPLLRVAGYGLLNANLTYVADSWSLGVFGRNLGNVDYAEDRGLATTYVTWGGQPRTFGARLTAQFK